KDRAVYSKDFDISQMYLILRKTGVISNPTNGWNKRPLDQHTEASDDMERIHLNRNVLVHCPTRRIDTTEFNNVALDLSVVCIRFDKTFKTCSIFLDFHRKRFISVIIKVHPDFLTKCYVRNNLSDSTNVFVSPAAANFDKEVIDCKI
ncbi:hypothetical protein MHBO_004621, partial [Bonamia ostreae]